MPTARRSRITKSAVDRMALDEVLRDTELKGFGARRQMGGPVYFLQKRINGRVRWLTIGAHGQPWTAEAARKEALRLLGSIAGGSDPAKQKRDRLDNPTLNEAARLFMEDHGPRLKPTTRDKYEILLRLYLQPAFGTQRVLDIQRPDIIRFHTKLAKKAGTANYCVAILSKLMSWAEEQGYRPRQSNPCFSIKKFPETKRQRYLTREEITRLGEVLTRVGNETAESLYVVAAIRLLLLTGARVGEILTLQWAFVDFERGFLRLPDSKTGPKHITLNTAALDVLTNIPRVKGNPFVIIGRLAKSRLINIQKPWRRIRKEAVLDDVRLHDLRHSFASVAAGSGGSLPLIGKLLGHNHTMTTARYAHLADDPTRELNQKVGNTIANALGGDVPSEASRLAADESKLKALRKLLADAERLRRSSARR